MTELQLREGKIFKTLLALCIPAMLAQFVNILYNIVDRIYIGNLQNVGNLALAGVGICAPIMSVISSFSFLVGLGAAPLVTMKLGEKKKEDAEKIMYSAAVVLCIISVLLFLFFLIFKDQILYLFGATEESFLYANQYFTVYLYAILGNVLCLGLNMFITCQGKSLIAMISVLIGAVINIILDPLLIYTFKMGVTGAALATLIAQYCSLIFILWNLFFNRTFLLKLKLQIQKIDFTVIKKILFLGFSPFLVYITEGFIVIFMNMAIKQNMGLESDLYIASLTIVLSFFQLLTYPMAGLTQGSQPLISYNIGARNLKRVKKTVYTLLSFCLTLSAVVLLISQINPLFFVKIFTKEESLTQLSLTGIKLYTIGALLLACQYAFVDSLLAMGKAKIAMFLSLFRKLIVFTPLVFILAGSANHNLIFLCEPISDVVAGILTTVTFVLLINRISVDQYENNAATQLLEVYNQEKS